MKNIKFLIILAAVSMSLNSCFLMKKSTPKMIIPEAVNTINSVQLRELNLKHGSDYTILNTVTAEATVIFSTQRKSYQITIEEENKEFKVVWKYDSDNDKWYCADYEGIARFGYLSNDYSATHTDWIAPEYTARNLAIYRLINASKVRGADGVIEPIISTNVEERGKDIYFKTTVSAKLIKLKTDAK